MRAGKDRISNAPNAMPKHQRKSNPVKNTNILSKTWLAERGFYIHVRYDAAASISGTATDAYVLTTALCGAGELVVA